MSRRSAHPPLPQSPWFFVRRCVRPFVLVVLSAGLAAGLLAGCTSDTSNTSAETTAVEATTAETTVFAGDLAGDGANETTSAATKPGDGSPAAGSIDVPADAVTIDYFVAKGTAPLLKETLVPLKSASKSVSMLVKNITYAGVVCGFSFTGADRPIPPVKFRMQIEAADGSVIDSTVDVDWTGDAEKAGSASTAGWNFLSDAQVNRNGPGWVVQVGAIPVGGGKGKPSPKRALCSLTSSVEMPTTVGPVAYWAGFATV